MTKDKLRRQVLELRHRQGLDVRHGKSKAIEQQLFRLAEFRAAAVILFYASIQSEVETHGMIRRALAEGKRVVLPKVKGKQLELFEIRNFDQDTVPGAWGIPEPENADPIDLAQIDLIVVPGSVFDERGNRVGYGAGFYDRLLDHFRGMTVALAFELQLVPHAPADAHDVPIKKIVTEKRIIDS